MSDTTYFKDTKPHYKLLDSLRGVAALMVIWYHVFEGYAFAGAVNGATDGSITTFNHGYLAVDFFFMLSGFVISYAYDNRWSSMGILQFFKRRLVRLHPMLIMGAIIGAAAFFVGGCTNWAGENIAPRLNHNMICISLIISNTITKTLRIDTIKFPLFFYTEF